MSSAAEIGIAFGDPFGPREYCLITKGTLKT
jgi:hypothetical protein